MSPVTSAREPVVLAGGPPSARVNAAYALLQSRGALRNGWGGPEPTLRAGTPVPADDNGAAGAIGAMLVLLGPNPPEAALALVGQAAELAVEIGGRVAVVGEIAAEAEVCVRGADTLITPRSWEPAGLAAALDRYLSGSSSAPQIVLAPATPWGHELAARLASRLDAGLISDAVELGIEGTSLVAAKPCGAGCMATIESRSTVQLATVRVGLLPDHRRAPRPVEVTELPVPEAQAVQRLATTTEDDFHALDRTGIVVAVGAGVQPDAYEDLEPLRSRLGAEFAATRRVTDLGWQPHSRQIGITGRTVAPHLYVAIGLSGSHNHLVGARRAKTVLAINSDATARVFAHCDIGIVGDWREIVPLLVAELDSRGRGRGR